MANFINSDKEYGIVSKILHAVIGLMMLIITSVGFYMSDLPNSPEKFQMYGMHKAFGVIVLCLVCFRLLWKLNNVTPIFELANWEQKLSRANFFLLYFLMFAMPVSGICMSLIGGREINIFNLYIIKALSTPQPEIAKIFWQAHGLFAICLVCSIALHFIGNLYHYFIKKDDLIKKMF